MTLEQWSQAITWSMSVIWLGLIIGCWYRARHYARRLHTHEDVLNHSYRRDMGALGPFLDPMKHLQAEGWQASAPLSRYDMIAYWRASAQADKQRMSSFIEMMPQFGLLGTVLSLFFSAFLFEFNMTMLGFALATTVFGLSGALWARATLEVPSEGSFFNILELLQNEEVVTRLVALAPTQEPTPSAQQPDKSTPLSFEITPELQADLQTDSPVDSPAASLPQEPAEEATITPVEESPTALVEEAPTIPAEEATRALAEEAPTTTEESPTTLVEESSTPTEESPVALVAESPAPMGAMARIYADPELHPASSPLPKPEAEEEPDEAPEEANASLSDDGAPESSSKALHVVIAPKPWRSE